MLKLLKKEKKITTPISDEEDRKQVLNFIKELIKVNVINQEIAKEELMDIVGDIIFEL